MNTNQQILNQYPADSPEVRCCHVLIQHAVDIADQWGKYRSNDPEDNALEVKLDSNVKILLERDLLSTLRVFEGSTEVLLALRQFDHSDDYIEHFYLSGQWESVIEEVVV